jgi:hypothetical protein
MIRCAENGGRSVKPVVFQPRPDPDYTVDTFSNQIVNAY